MAKIAIFYWERKGRGGGGEWEGQGKGRGRGVKMSKIFSAQTHEEPKTIFNGYLGLLKIDFVGSVVQMAHDAKGCSHHQPRAKETLRRRLIFFNVGMATGQQGEAGMLMDEPPQGFLSRGE